MSVVRASRALRAALVALEQRCDVVRHERVDAVRRSG